MAVLEDRLKIEIDERVPDLIATRRDLHEHPELAFEEVRTSRIVAQRLQAIGLEVQTGIAKTGVVGILRGEKASSTPIKTVALRADMDALPIHEQNEIDYRSQTDGKMHACGHDGHTAILLTVAEILTQHKADIAGNIKFIFQPAEEQVRGAQPMVEAGVMDGVDGVLGLHLISSHPFGRVGVCSGTVFASTDRLNLTVHGKGGHAAMPHLAVDPIVIAAHIITTMQTLISRETSPFSPAVITFGMINAGTASNIIPEKVELAGTMRSYTPEHREYLRQRAPAIAQGIATSMGGSCSVEIEKGCPPCINDEKMAALVRRAAIQVVGEAAIDSDDTVRTTGGDDMAYFLNAAPGCYFIVGAQNADKDANYPHHHPRFNIDEDALPLAVEILIRATLDFLHQA